MAARRSGGYLSRPAPSGLADVVELVLDKGIVIDAYARVSLLGVELLTMHGEGRAPESVATARTKPGRGDDAGQEIIIPLLMSRLKVKQGQMP